MTDQTDLTTLLAGVLYLHREDALTCYDHPPTRKSWCCVCGEHDLTVSHRAHLADAILRAGFGPVREVEAERDVWRKTAERKAAQSHTAEAAHAALVARIEGLAAEFARRQARNAAHNGNVSCSVWGIAGAEVGRLAESTGTTTDTKEQQR